MPWDIGSPEKGGSCKDPFRLDVAARQGIASVARKARQPMIFLPSPHSVLALLESICHYQI